MNLERTVLESKALLWRFLPISMFNPKEGDRTLMGVALKERPSLKDENSKFAVFSDPRFFDKKHYEKLIPFLPEEIKVVGPPNGQNAFMYALGILPSERKRLGIDEYTEEFEKRGYKYGDFSEKTVQKGDVVEYIRADDFDSWPVHAGIYVGNGHIRSRWGYNSPLLEHPVLVVLPRYLPRSDSRSLISIGSTIGIGRKTKEEFPEPKTLILGTSPLGDSPPEKISYKAELVTVDESGKTKVEKIN